jgi:uncharacterized protein (DUF885 family)
MKTSRRRVVLALGSSLLVPMMSDVALAQTPSGADRTFEALGRRYLETYFRLAPVEATKIGEHRYDRNIDDLSASGRAAFLRFLQRTLSDLGRIDHARLSRANQVDAAMLENQLRGQIWGIERQQAYAWNTLYYQAKAGDAIYAMLSREFAPIATRLENLTYRLERLPRVFEQARAELVVARVPAPYAQTYAGQNPGLKSLIEELVTPSLGALSGAKRTRLDAAVARFNAAVDEHQTWIEGTLVPGAQAEWRAGAEMFDEGLALALMSPMSRQQIRQRADAEVARIRAEMYVTAKRALAGAPEAPDAPTAEQQQAVIRAALDISGAERPARTNVVEVATAAVGEAERFIRAHNLIALPDEPVRVIPLPEFQQGVAVAYCDSPGPLERNLATYYTISPIPAGWTDEQAASFLREYNNRAIIVVGVHEAMPGHYVQLWHANAYPSVLRAVLASGTFIEGWACYAQQMMVEEGFKSDDPLYRLAEFKVLLRSVTNAILDQAVHVDGMSQEEAMRFLTETAFQEEREAAGKWRRAQLSANQLSTYFVGYLEHREARAAAEAARGAQFNLKTYHDGILSFGSPPARFARQLLLEEPIQ